jgi:metal-sulfur cluster biosynthetic enzyme
MGSAVTGTHAIPLLRMADHVTMGRVRGTACNKYRDSDCLLDMDRKEFVVEALRGVLDPHTGVSVYDMGLISDIVVSQDSVSLTFMPTSPFCPVGVELAKAIRDQVLLIDGVKRCDVKVVGHVRADEINRQLNA